MQHNAHRDNIQQLAIVAPVLPVSPFDPCHINYLNEGSIHDFVIVFFQCCNGIGGIPSTK